MSKKNYEQTGERIVIDGIEYFCSGYYDDGCSDGWIYKNEEAFFERPDEVCYVPEAEFDDDADKVIDGKEFFKAEGYTRKDLERLVKGETDYEGEPIDVEYLFQTLTWMCPETRLNELLEC